MSIIQEDRAARHNLSLLGLGAHCTEAIFHKAEVVEISGKGKF